MNDLEQWLSDVRAFNASAQKILDGGLDGPLAELLFKQDTINAQGRFLGLKRSKIKSMLASVRLKVEMPEEKAGT